MPSKKRINQILEILRLSDNDFKFLGSYNNPDFDYFSDVDVDQYITLDENTPVKIKELLQRIKKYGPIYQFGFVEIKFGMDKSQYFRSNNLSDYNNKYNKKFKNLEEARLYVKDKYTNRIFDINASLDEIKKKLINPKLIKLYIIVRDEPNFMIELIYKFKDKPISIVKELLDDIDKHRLKGRWDKVAKRLYSIAKLIDDEERKTKILNILSPYLRDIWLYKSLDIPQSKEWIKYVKDQNIDFEGILENLKRDLIDNFII